MSEKKTTELAEDSIHEAITYVIEKMGNDRIQPIVRQALVAFTLAHQSALTAWILSEREPDSHLIETYQIMFEEYQALGEKYLEKIRIYSNG